MNDHHLSRCKRTVLDPARNSEIVTKPLLNGVGPPLGPFQSQISDTTSPGSNIEVFSFNESHQVYYRVAGGNTDSPAYWQRCMIYTENRAPRSDAERGALLATTPNVLLGGEGQFAQPTDWYSFPAQHATSGTWTYYFCGQAHWNNFKWDKGVRRVLDQYQYGRMATLYFDDDVGDGQDDNKYDDYIIQVAIVAVAFFDPLEHVTGKPRASSTEIGPDLAGGGAEIHRS